MKLRPYQQKACDAALAFMRTSVSPCLIDAAPAAGKSFMIAYIANTLHKISGGKRVLCLMPNSTLVSQNAEKYRMTGEPCSIFSATAGSKSTRHNVIMATAGTVKNAISRFADGSYCAVILDEADAALTPTVLSIIEAMREGNPNLRVLGLTGTPYRLGHGYIFRQWPDGRANGDDKARDPYFTKCVYRVSAREMLDDGFITPMDIGAIGAEEYDTSGVVLLPNGRLDDHSVEQAFVGHGRKTASIVADVMRQARNRPGGIMYFAATVQHAHEIMASLPPDTSACVTGETGKETKTIIERYRQRKVRHLVSVNRLAVGFDVSHTETIALLRYTESARLLQQIMGRAWRLDDAKPRALLLDYAGNVERHHPDGDLYNPEIRAKKTSEGGHGMKCLCPDCGYENEFTGNPDYADYAVNEHGYCLDVFGEPIMTDYGPMAAHYGRRCFGMVRVGDKGEYERCSYRWAGKPCPECEEANDIAARYCYVCRAEIVDVNEKLSAEFARFKRSPDQPQTDRVISVAYKPSVSRAGNPTMRSDWTTEHRKFSIWVTDGAKHPSAKRDWAMFQEATNGCSETPETISYMKTPEGFYRILGFGGEPDSIESMMA